MIMTIIDLCGRQKYNIKINSKDNNEDSIKKMVK